MCYGYCELSLVFKIEDQHEFGILEAEQVDRII